MVDIFDRIKQNPGPLGQFANYAEGYFIFPRLEGPIGPRMRFQGREVIFWSANDYLGLCNHPEVLEADAKAAAEYGMFYPMGARAMSGETDQNKALVCDSTLSNHSIRIIFGNAVETVSPY